MDYPLPPIIHRETRSLLHRQSPELYKLLDMFGSPVNVIFPEVMQTTAKRFRETLDDAGLHEGQIYFAAKANKANAFLAASAASKAGVDVSSVYELRAALGNGVPGAAISVSGPTKPPELLALACVHNARIGIDEPSEIDSIVAIAKSLALSQSVRIYLRIAAGTSKVSRFGMEAQTITKVLHRLRELKKYVQLEGFSFHVPGYSTGDRVHMIGVACEKLIQAADLGFAASRIDIGGGFMTAYASSDSWDAQRALDREFVGNVKPHVMYPYAAKTSGAAQLQEILDGAKTILADTSDKLKRQVMVDIEPGRSALEQAGITAFRVRAVRTIGDRNVVVVDGNSRDLADSVGNEFLVDPVLLTQRNAPEVTFAAAIASNTCKEDDYLARRFIPLPFRPAAGDLLVYVNTAGYEMDSKESSFHRMPVPTKIVATHESSGWRFVTDQTFSLIDCLGAEAGAA